ncbi:MAG TPA: methyltransferase [Steroidobacteraceae bacterium]|nr:methyltransferase [Steroidobacteraceae bacterium]
MSPAAAAETRDSEGRLSVEALIKGCWSTQVIHAAVSLGIADALGTGMSSAEEIARATHTNAPALLRLLRALCVLGLCRPRSADGFELTAAGRWLCSDVPGSLRSVAMHWGGRTWPGLGELAQAVKSGHPWAHGGRDGFVSLGRKPEQAATFNRSMADQTLAVAGALIEAYDFGRFGTVFDVGGGYGALLAAVLLAHPHLAGASLDLDYMAGEAQQFLQSTQLAERARFIGCDFFAAVPAGADCYLLKYILHDWGDEECVAILGNCRDAAGAAGTILVIEQLAPLAVQPIPEHTEVIRSDINMLAVTGGRERTIVEYNALFARAGLALGRVVPTRSAFSLLEALRQPE